MTFMPSVLLCCRHISPCVYAHSRDFYNNPLCMIAVNIPVYIYISLFGRVCALLVSTIRISMCYIGRRDVGRLHFSANVSQPTAQPQQEE